MRTFARLGFTRSGLGLVRVAVLLILCSNLAACGGATGVGSAPSTTATTLESSLSSPTPAATSQALLGQPSLTYLHMLNGEQGWATGYNIVLRTADGGAHWQDMTPAGCHSPGSSAITSVAALDALTLWLACQQGATGGSQPTNVLFQTRDGGQHWQEISPHLAPGISVEGLTFVDASHGWLADSQGSATGHHYLTLYGTTDGGATWHERTKTDQPNGPASAALGSGPVFLNATTGWLGSDLGAYTGRPNQFALWVTQDGGATWVSQALPEPNGQVMGTTAPPSCFDSQHCAIILQPFAVPPSGSANPPQPFLLLYVSSDGGKTWTPQPLVALQASNVEFLDLAHGWAVVNPNPPNISACDPSASLSAGNRSEAIAASSPQPNVLEGTTDGGQHWTALNSTVNWCNVQALDFISPQQGWALSGIPGAASTLLQTTNGGVTWTALPWQSA